MILDAFTSKELLSNIPVQIESICTHEDRLFVGTKQGTLLVYKFENDKIDLFLTLKCFAKRSINQLALVSVLDLNQLLCLSEGVLTIHNILPQSIQLPGEQLSKARGATIFALHQSCAIDDPPSAQLAVAVKRKLILYHWLKKGLPQVVKEITLYDSPKAMVFHGDSYSDQLYIGLKGKYCQLQLSTENVKELFCTGKQPEATMLWVDRDTVAICKDEWSILLGEDGKPQDEFKSNIKWCDCPTGLLQCKPYIGAIIGKGLEIKTKQLVDPIQLIELPRVRFVAQDKRIFVASTTHLWELKLNDLVYQVDKLISIKQFDLAETLNKMTNETKSGITDQNFAARQRKINTQAAYHEFMQRQYDKSMSRFQRSNVEVANVIGLFPDLLSKKMQDRQEYPPEIVEARKYLTTKDVESGIEALEKYLVAKRFDLNKYEDEVENSKQIKIIIDTTLLKCYLLNKPKMVASLLRLRDNECHILESEKALKKARRMNDIIILYKSKGLHEKALTALKQYANMQSTQKHELGGPDHTIKYLQDLGPSDIHLIKEFSRWVIEKHPDKCLDIFLDPNTVHSLPQLEVVDHLKSINPDIALQYLERLVDIWNVNTADIENSLILLLVEKISQEWPAYQGILASHGVEPSPPGSEPGKLGTLRNSLIHFLERLQNYSPSLVIRHLGYEVPLYQELAVLYGRQRDYDKALALYCHVIKDRQKAEDFCHKNLKHDNQIYYKLLLMFQCPKSLEALRLDKFKLDEPKPDLDTAIDILIKHYKYIDVKEALRLLPDNTKLQEVEEFLCAILRDRTRDKHQNQLLRSLNLSDNLRVKAEKFALQKDKLIITGQDSCSVCNKRVGECAVAFYPDRRIVHYGCMSIEEKQINGHTP